MKLVHCFIFILSIFLLAISCDKDSSNPVGPGTSDEYGSIVVTTADNDSIPTEGVIVTVRQDGKDGEMILETNAEGIARFDSLPQGRYQLISSSGKMDGDRLIIDHIVRDIFVKLGKVTPIRLYYAAGPSDSEYCSIQMRAVDEYENPFEGIFVKIRRRMPSPKYEELYYAYTDAAGIARFDSLPPGEYTINVENYDLHSYDKIIPEAPGLKHNMYLGNVSAGEIVQKTFYFPVGPVDVFIQADYEDEEYGYYDNVELCFPDWERTVALDAQGYGILDNVELTDIDTRGTLQGVASSDGKAGLFNTWKSTDSDGRLFLDVTVLSRPLLEVVVPQNDAVFPTGSVQLTCTSNDLRDGSLPDDVISWHSDIDGELGTGHDIHVDLSIGRHKILVRGVDSDGNTNSDVVYVTVTSYSDYSYFPFPQDGIWKYRYAPSDLVVFNGKGETERWTLADIQVSVVDHTMRTCQMDWAVERDGDEMLYLYTLTDHIITEGNSFLVTASEELLKIYDGDELIEELSVETVYSPSYPMLKDYLDPQAGTHEEITVTAENVIKYNRPDIGSRSRTDIETVTVSSQTRSPENVTTAAGTFSAIPFISRYNGVERTWWLAQGIGIVQMEYDLFGETVTASLYETNMGDFAAGAGKIAANAGNSAPVRIQFDTSGDDAGRMREIMNVMRGMCPR